MWAVELEPVADGRGSFTRVYAEDVFEELGLATHFPHHNVVFNATRGTLRGLHYQAPPWGEVKVVNCIAGEIFDVLVDLRPDSPTFKQVATFTLRASTPSLLYVPAGVAHGYQTMKDQTMVHYLMGTVYRPEAARGIAWDEPQLEIDWPIRDPILSERDRGHPPLNWETALTPISD